MRQGLCDTFFDGPEVAGGYIPKEKLNAPQIDRRHPPRGFL